ncbi:DUF2157 domain-containing protein [Pedobacter sp. HDW13]|uniref:DUF2157 domain-containing protein n=1 Tax=Pedobacter sp. HDW13 TaxID=2714940 RepID=UPI001409EFB6|nr:DUF2157 domain-containing protein [Pedobacter sp. HDW13]QIL38369.1 DUF2157 domain-containing protein [Pedobacter sp. HDW13]
MTEPGVTRRTLQIIARNSNLSAEELETQFKEQGIYADKKGWAKYIEIALIGIGAAFVISGIIFFLAYNWHLLQRFLKLGLVQLLVIATVLTSFVFKRNQLVRSVLLMSASVLVGAMFSVFGQVYQTGADAYDFFLGWTVFIIIWALVADFPPLWLLAMALINITISLYVDQIAPYWPSDLKYLLLFVLNSVVLIVIQLLPSALKASVPNWLIKVISLSIATYITIGAALNIFDKDHRYWFVFFLLAFMVYTLAVYHSFKHKSLFHLCIVPLSLLIIICCWITESHHQEYGTLFFFMSVFVVASITLLTKLLVNLNKSWNE